VFVRTYTYVLELLNSNLIAVTGCADKVCGDF